MIRKSRNIKNRNKYSILFPILTIIVIGIISAISSNYTSEWLFNWNDVRGEIKDSIKLASYRGITSGVGGMGRSTKDEVNSRIWIMKNATKSELQKLTEYPNGTIKAISYEGLIKKKEVDNKYKYDLIIRAIKDTTYQVSYQSGCLGWERSIGEYLIQDILRIDDRLPPVARAFRASFGLTDSQRKKILIEFKKTLEKEKVANKM